MTLPILLLSDAPDQTSGLARITRDLATLLASDPDWRVATLGWMGTGSRVLPWPQYHMFPQEMGESSLPVVWDEWSEGRPGIIMTVWDATRLLWLARPEYAPEGLKEWIQKTRSAGTKLWGYFPIDSCGPGGRLTGIVRETLLGYDRILVTSPWAVDVVRATIGDQEAEKRNLTWAPHGLGSNFTPGPSLEDKTRIGVVMTNQARKDWGLCGAIAHSLPDVRFWWHVDVVSRHWNLEALLEDFNLHNVEITLPPCDDKWLASQYRRCALTILPSLGEGFGYCWAESIACGVPCIHGNYASGASLMDSCGLGHLLVEPWQYRIEGIHNCVRPVYTTEDWVTAIREVLASPADPVSNRVEHLLWKNLWTVWKRWFSDGVGTSRNEEARSATAVTE